MPVFSSQRGYAQELADALVMVDADTSGFDEAVDKLRQDATKSTADIEGSFGHAAAGLSLHSRTAGREIAMLTAHMLSGTGTVRNYISELSLLASVIHPMGGLFASMAITLGFVAASFLGTRDSAKSTADAAKALSDELADLAKAYEVAAGSAREFIAARSEDIQTKQAEDARKAVEAANQAYKDQLATLKDITAEKAKPAPAPAPSLTAPITTGPQAAVAGLGGLEEFRQAVREVTREPFKLDLGLKDAIQQSEELRTKLRNAIEELTKTNDVKAFRAEIDKIALGLPPAQAARLQEMTKGLTEAGAAAAKTQIDFDAASKGMDTAALEKYTAKVHELRDSLNVLRAKIGLPLLVVPPAGQAPATAPTAVPTPIAAPAAPTAVQPTAPAAQVASLDLVQTVRAEFAAGKTAEQITGLSKEDVRKLLETKLGEKVVIAADGSFVTDAMFKIGIDTSVKTEGATGVELQKLANDFAEKQVQILADQLAASQKLTAEQRARNQIVVTPAAALPAPTPAAPTALAPAAEAAVTTAAVTTDAIDAAKKKVDDLSGTIARLQSSGGFDAEVKVKTAELDTAKQQYQALVDATKAPIQAEITVKTAELDAAKKSYLDLVAAFKDQQTVAVAPTFNDDALKRAGQEVADLEKKVAAAGSTQVEIRVATEQLDAAKQKYQDLVAAFERQKTVGVAPSFDDTALKQAAKEVDDLEQKIAGIGSAQVEITVATDQLDAAKRKYQELVNSFQLQQVGVGPTIDTSSIVAAEKRVAELEGRLADLRDAGVADVRLQVTTDQLDEARKKYQSLVDAVQLGLPSVTPTVTTEQVTRAKNAVDDLAGTVARLQSSGGFEAELSVDTTKLEEAKKRYQELVGQAQLGLPTVAPKITTEDIARAKGAVDDLAATVARLQASGRFEAELKANTEALDAAKKKYQDLADEVQAAAGITATVTVNADQLEEAKKKVTDLTTALARATEQDADPRALASLSAAIGAAEASYQSLLRVFQLQHPEAKTVVTTTEVDAAKKKVDDLASEIARLQASGAFEATIKVKAEPAAAPMPAHAPSVLAVPAAAPSAPVAAAATSAATATTAQVQALQPILTAAPAAQQELAQTSDQAAKSLERETAAAKELGMSLDVFEAPQTSEAVRQHGRDLADLADQLRQTQELDKFREKTKELNDQIAALAKGGSFTAAGRQALTMSEALRGLNVTPEAFAKWPKAARDVVTGMVTATESVHDLTKSAADLNALTKQFEELRNKVIIANAPTSELRHLLQSLGGGVDLSKIVDETGHVRAGMEGAVTQALALQKQLALANVKNALEDQIDALRNKAIAANAPTQQLRDFLTSISAIKGVDLADFFKTGRLTPELQTLFEKLQQIQGIVDSGQLKQLGEQLDFQASLTGVPERYQAINEALHQMGINAQVYADGVHAGIGVTEEQRQAILNAVAATDRLHDAQVAVGQAQSDNAKLLELEASAGDEAAATRLKVLETEQKIAELRREGITVPPAVEAQARTEAGKTPEQKQRETRITEGSKLPDDIDAANVAAENLSQTLTDIDNLSFDSLKESFRQIAQQIAQMIVKALIFQAIMAAIGGASPTPAPAGGSTANPAAGGGSAGGMFSFARGGVIDRSRVIPAAHGMVIPRLIPAAQGMVLPRPTLIPLASGATVLARESGPEAILPLGRTPGGDLGVKTTGPRGSQQGATMAGGDTLNFDFRGMSPGAVADAMNQVYAAARRDVFKELSRSPTSRRSIGLRGGVR